jgi:hypothetical protein
MTKFILDTDHITLHQHIHPTLTGRIEILSDTQQLAVTIISFEEQVRGCHEILCY